MPELHEQVPKMDQLLEEVVLREASDLHLRVGEPPLYRIGGRLNRSEFPVLTEEDSKSLLYSVMTEEQQRRYERDLELDMAFGLPGVARFRINVFRQRGYVGAVLRVIPLRVKTIDEWGLPPILKELSLLPRGMVLVTGPTGSGKTTSLSAMVEHMNQNRKGHVITLEDPIEYLHKDSKAIIEQREIGTDTPSFATALRHVMRQNPDVILVGEMRDYETMSLSLAAAETGHLVMATLHTTDAAQTVDRIINTFPPDSQAQARVQLATVLQAVVSQALLPTVSNRKQVAAFEIMLATPAIKSVIREGKTPQIYSLIQTGSKFGMVSLDQSLKELFLKNLVTLEDALAKSSNPVDLEQSIGR
ncbi:MAG: type IV pilus twitching motility protein PilT [Candidatus Edwardsbacteria bacterium]|nr:type IV pilus twitching motility protein PilT [Candidatus Edwardsbacteria bacterium]